MKLRIPTVAMLVPHVVWNRVISQILSRGPLSDLFPDKGVVAFIGNCWVSQDGTSESQRLRSQLNAKSWDLYALHTYFITVDTCHSAERGTCAELSQSKIGPPYGERRSQRVWTLITSESNYNKPGPHYYDHIDVRSNGLIISGPLTIAGTDSWNSAKNRGGLGILSGLKWWFYKRLAIGSLRVANLL